MPPKVKFQHYGGNYETKMVNTRDIIFNNNSDAYVCAARTI